ncbi:MAG: 2-hydroxyacyl-CoA dehydratase family protein [Dehalococcoidia bacterium]|nr:2-hydroxyacyl-CoA dehydratase family protein [Dehalococcoidia bacterium]
MSTERLSRLEKLYSNRSERAVNLRGQGRKVIGYFCAYNPLEIMTALDIVPYRITGAVDEPITKANAYLETIMCPFVRSAFDLSLKGRYDFLDGLLVPHTCDTVQRIYGIWDHYNKPFYSHFIDVPHMLQPSSYGFFKNELITFQKSLEELTGKKLTAERLKREIELHNTQRKLLRDLYQLRKVDPPLISGAEVLKTLIVAMSLPPEEANDLIKDVIKEVKAGAKGPGKAGARLMIYGCEIDDAAFMNLVEGSGANVVADDLCIGTRFFWEDVPVTADPLDGLAKRYMELRCPRTYRDKATGTTHEEDIKSRFAYLGDFAREFNVNGVILYIIRFCDTHELDAPDVIEYLKGLGLPVLHIEDDYSATTIGQLSTRVQAFLETIR